jgi:hypothetical protein
VEQTLYKLDASLLKDCSTVLHDMFAMPSQGSQAQQPSSTLDDAGSLTRTKGVAEGTSDSNPIRLQPPVTVEKFDNLLRWFYKRSMTLLLVAI